MALQSDWVNKAMGRSWARIGLFEARMFNDLKKFCTPQDDFKWIRPAMERVVDSKAPEFSSHTSSVASVSGADSGKGKASDATPTSCVPFIGQY